MKIKIILTVLIIGGLTTIVAISDFGKNKETPSEISEVVQNQDSTELSLPSDFPADIPMYPGSILKNSQESNSETERNITLSLVTEDSVSDVNTWYRGALNQNGWAITSDNNVGGYVLLKGENQNLTIFMQAANNEDGLVTITQRVRIR